MKVYVTKEVPRNCSICLYGRGWGCGNADRQKNWMKIAMLGMHCPSYWLDQDRFEPVDGKRW